MNSLSDALGIGPNEIVAFVGAGGKTSSIYRLVRELSAARRKTLVTTTTKIYAPAPDQAEALVLHPDLDALIGEINREFADRDSVVAGRRIVSVKGEEKVEGVPPEWGAPLFERTQCQELLVEADGSAHKSIKAPNDTEPIYPAGVTRVVVVAGLDAVDAPLNEDIAFRIERITAITNLQIGQPITEQNVVTLLTHPAGLKKGIPPAAAPVLLLNKAETPDRISAGRRIAEKVIENGHYERVVLSSLIATDPVIDVIVA